MRGMASTGASMAWGGTQATNATTSSSRRPLLGITSTQHRLIGEVTSVAYRLQHEAPMASPAPPPPTLVPSEAASSSERAVWVMAEAAVAGGSLNYCVIGDIYLIVAGVAASDEEIESLRVLLWVVRVHHRQRRRPGLLSVRVLETCRVRHVVAVPIPELGDVGIVLHISRLEKFLRVVRLWILFFFLEKKLILDKRILNFVFQILFPWVNYWFCLKRKL